MIRTKNARGEFLWNTRTEYLHEHGIAHTHGEGHGHVHENTKAVLNRLARAIGHLGVGEEDGGGWARLLRKAPIQLSAVRSAINNIGKVILEDHIQHCIVDAVELGDQEAIANLCQAIDKFVR